VAVTFESQNGFLLKNGDETISYKLCDENGNEYVRGELFEYAPQMNYSGVHSVKVKATVEDGQETKPGGTYRDVISFTVTYNSGKPEDTGT